MQLSRILGFTPDYLARLHVANVSTDRDLADYTDLDGLSGRTGIPVGVLKQLSEVAEWNVEASSKRLRALALVAVLVIGSILTFAAWLKIKSYLDLVDRNANLAIGYMKDGDKACSQNHFPAGIEAGIESYKSAITIIPKLDKYHELEAQAHYGLGGCYLMEGRFSLAVSQFEEATQDDPDNPSYLLQLGIAYLALNHPDSAIAAFENAYKIWSDDFSGKRYENIARVELWQGIAYFLNGDYEKAINNLHYLESQLLSDHEKYLCESTLGKSFYLSTLSPAIQKSIRDGPYVLTIKITNAIGYLHSAIKLEDRDAEDHAILGMALLKHGESAKEKQEAKAECGKALKLDPNNGDARACLDSVHDK